MRQAHKMEKLYSILELSLATCCPRWLIQENIATTSYNFDSFPLFCTFITVLIFSCLLLQLRVSNLHGDTDCLWHEVPGNVKHGPPGLGHAKLSRRTQIQREDIGSWNESQSVQRRLLSGWRQGTAANTLDGLGICSPCKYINNKTSLATIMFSWALSILSAPVVSEQLIATLLAGVYDLPAR